MSVFLERFVLTVLAAGLVGTVLTNPWRLDKVQQATLVVAIVALALFTARTIDRMRLPAEVAVMQGGGDADAAAAPRLAVEAHQVIAATEVVGMSADGVALRHTSFARITVKNDPMRGGEGGVAKNVTAQIVYSTATGHHRTIQGYWDWETRQQPAPKVIDNFVGGGHSVWFNAGQRRELLLAFKVVGQQNAYAMIEQPNVADWQVEAPGLALPPGEYRVVVELRSSTSSIREDFAFKLVNRGGTQPLELTPIP